MSAQRVQQEPQLAARRREQGHVTVLELHGAGDLATLEQLKSALADARSARVDRRVVVDASGLDFCDVSCARVLWEATRRGHVEVTGMSVATRRVLTLLDSDAGHQRHARVPASRRGELAGDLGVVALAPRRTPQTPMEPAPRAPRSA